MCRVEPTEVRYAFTEDGRYGTYILGGILPLPRWTAAQSANGGVMSGAPPTADESEQSPITPAQVQRSLLVHRLRQLPIYEPDVWTVPPERAYIIEGENYIVATRGLGLRITQRNVGTAIILKRALKLHTIPIHSPGTLNLDLTLPQKPADVSNARAEIEAVLASLGDRRDTFATLTIEDPEMFVLADANGLDVSIEKNLKIKREREGALVSEVKFERMTTLIEVLPDVIGGEMSQDDTERLGAFSAQQRERAVRLVRMEIQGALETVMPFAQDFEELEEATTGILDIVPLERVECEYCPVRHRNGDCLLPWVIV
jgi:hypothetical protein